MLLIVHICPAFFSVCQKIAAEMRMPRMAPGRAGCAESFSCEIDNHYNQ